MSRSDTIRRARRHQLFTVDQANSALPLVRRIVTDISNQYRELDRLAQLRQRLVQLNRRDVAEAFDKIAIQGIKRLNELIEELEAIGCDMKDWHKGQVDFRAIRNGREVCLCWHLGEDEISHWHEVYAGPTERKVIDEHFLRLPKNRIRDLTR